VEGAKPLSQNAYGDSGTGGGEARVARRGQAEGLVRRENVSLTVGNAAKAALKGLFSDAEWDPRSSIRTTGLLVPIRGTVLRPGRKLVDEFECSPGRSCYEQL
jgi:hypothetical protein